MRQILSVLGGVTIFTGQVTSQSIFDKWRHSIHWTGDVTVYIWQVASSQS